MAENMAKQHSDVVLLSHDANLAALPTEILIAIADCLLWPADILHLMLACKRLAELLPSHLYAADGLACMSIDHAIETGNNALLRTALASRCLVPTRRHLKAAIKSLNREAVEQLLTERIITEQPRLSNHRTLAEEDVLAALNSENLAIFKLVHSHAKKERHSQSGAAVNLIFEAIRMGHSAIVQYLAEEGQEAFILNDDQLTTLDFAIQDHRLKIARYLADFGVPYTLANPENSRHLANFVKVAAAWEHFDVIEFVQNRWPINFMSIKTALRERFDFNSGRYINTTVLMRLLHSDFDITATHGSLTMSPLAMAIQYGDIKAAELLFRELKDFPDPYNVKDSCTLYAAWYGACDLLEILLESGVDPNTTDIEGQSAARLAVLGGHADCFHLLVRYGAKWKESNAEGHTLLMSTSCPEIARWLIEYGVDPLAQDSNQATALELACESGRSDVVSILLPIMQSKNQDGEYVPARLLTASVHGQCLETTTAIASLPTTNTVTARTEAFMQAAERGLEELAEFLYSLKISAVSVNFRGNSPLHHAAVRALPDEIIIGLLEDGADPNLPQPELWSSFIPKTTTPWLAAFRFNIPTIEVIQAFLRHGADVHATDDGWSVFHMAAQRNEIHAVEALLETGVLDVNIKCKDTHGPNWTPLDYTIRSHAWEHLTTPSSKLATVKLLLSHGGSTATPLSLSALAARNVYRGVDDYILKILIVEKKVDVKAVNETGQTMLHVAAAQDYDNVILALLFCGADVDALDQDGLSAFDIAEKNVNAKALWAIIAHVCIARGDAHAEDLRRRLRDVMPQWRERERLARR